MSECGSFVARDDWSSALDACRGALEGHGGRVFHLRCFEGLCCTQLGRHEEAYTAYSAAWSLRSRSAAAAPALKGIVELAGIAPHAVEDNALCAALRQLRSIDYAQALATSALHCSTLERLLLLELVDCETSATGSARLAGGALCVEGDARAMECAEQLRSVFPANSLTATADATRAMILLAASAATSSLSCELVASEGAADTGNAASAQLSQLASVLWRITGPPFARAFASTSEAARATAVAPSAAMAGAGVDTITASCNRLRSHLLCAPSYIPGWVALALGYLSDRAPAEAALASSNGLRELTILRTTLSDGVGSSDAQSCRLEASAESRRGGRAGRGGRGGRKGRGRERDTAGADDGGDGVAVGAWLPTAESLLKLLHALSLVRSGRAHEVAAQPSLPSVQPPAAPDAAYDHDNAPLNETWRLLTLRVHAEIALSKSDIDTCESCCRAAMVGGASAGGLAAPARLASWAPCWKAWLDFLRDGNEALGCVTKGMEQLPHTAPDYALVAYWRARMLWSSRSVAAPEGEGKARQGYLDAAHDPACAEWARAAATAAPEWAKPHELLGLLLLLDAPKASLSNGLGKGEGSAYWHLTRAVELDPTCGAAGAALVALLLMGSKAGAEGEGEEDGRGLGAAEAVCADAVARSPVDGAAWAEVLLGCFALQRAELAVRPARANEADVAAEEEDGPTLNHTSRRAAARERKEHLARATRHCLSALRATGASATSSPQPGSARDCWNSFASHDQAPDYADGLGVVVIAWEALAAAYSAQGRLLAAVKCLGDRLALASPPPDQAHALVAPVLLVAGSTPTDAAAALLAGHAPIGSLPGVPLTNPLGANAVSAAPARVVTLHCALADLLMRAADSGLVAHGGSSTSGGMDDEEARVAHEMIESATALYGQALSACPQYAPALIGAARLAMREAQTASASGLTARAAEKWNEAITQICRSSSAHDATSDSADTASMSYEARLLLFEALAAATRLPRALQRQLLASLGGTLAENLREETGVCSPPTSLTLACRRAASELVRAFPDDREAWRTFVRGCDELPTECAGTQEGDEGDEGDEADKGDGDDEIELEGGTFCERRADGSPTAAKARPVLEWLIKSPGSDNANQRAWTWYLLGLHTMRRGEIGVAQHAFATAARVDRFAAAPWVAYGELCLGRGNSSLAEQAFARALQLEDCNGDACAPPVAARRRHSDGGEGGTVCWPAVSHNAWLGLARCAALKLPSGDAGMAPFLHQGRVLGLSVALGGLAGHCSPTAASPSHSLLSSPSWARSPSAAMTGAAGALPSRREEVTATLEAMVSMLTQSVVKHVTVAALAALAAAASYTSKAHLASTAAAMLVVRSPALPEGHCLLAEQMVRAGERKAALDRLRTSVRLLQNRLVRLTRRQSGQSGGARDLCTPTRQQLDATRLRLAALLLSSEEEASESMAARSEAAELLDAADASLRSSTDSPAAADSPAVARGGFGRPRGFGAARSEAAQPADVKAPVNHLAAEIARLRAVLDNGGTAVLPSLIPTDWGLGGDDSVTPPSLDEASLARSLWSRAQLVCLGRPESDVAAKAVRDAAGLIEQLAAASASQLEAQSAPSTASASAPEENLSIPVAAVTGPKAQDASGNTPTTSEKKLRPSKQRRAEERKARFNPDGPPPPSPSPPAGAADNADTAAASPTASSKAADIAAGGADAPEAAPTETPAALADGTLAVEVTATVNGHRVSVQRRDIDNEEGPDPYFFEADYSVAASTGMLMWEGSWAAIELLRAGTRPGGAPRWFADLVRGKRVVELGSGIGLLGLCVAAAGAHVLMTDVPSVVECTLGPNVLASGPEVTAPSEPSAAVTAAGVSSVPWANARQAGTGTASAQALDWWQAVSEQSEPNDPMQADVILAAECVWLRELIDPFVETVLTLMKAPQRPICVLAFRDRSKATSETFSSLSLVLGAFEAKGVVGVERGVNDAPESEGLMTSFYELRLSGTHQSGTGT